MPQKEEQFSKSTWRRHNKRISEEMTSLVDSSTPVYARPTQKTSNPKDVIQGRKLSSVPENIVTATATSTSERDVHDKSSESSSDSDVLDLEGKKLFPTAVKKKKEE